MSAPPPAAPFETRLFVAWADLDLNGHMRNSAFLEKSVDVRMMFFVSRGFDVAEFARLKLGPVVKSDQIRYFREVGLLANLRATLALAGSSADGSRFQMRNEFHRDDGQMAAQVDTVGGWLDIATRRLTAPPAAILAALGALGRTEDFAVLPSSLRP
jgi:acyl-CoA thioester hydrolase